MNIIHSSGLDFDYSKVSINIGQHKIFYVSLALILHILFAHNNCINKKVEYYFILNVLSLLSCFTSLNCYHVIVISNKLIKLIQSYYIIQFICLLKMLKV